MSNDKVYMWTWYTVDPDQVSTVIMMANPAFGETGKYTLEECSLLNQAVKDIAAPLWIHREWSMEHLKEEISPEEQQMKEYNKQIMDRFEELKAQI